MLHSYRRQNIDASTIARFKLDAANPIILIQPKSSLNTIKALSKVALEIAIKKELR